MAEFLNMLENNIGFSQITALCLKGWGEGCLGTFVQKKADTIKRILLIDKRGNN